MGRVADRRLGAVRKAASTNGGAPTAPSAKPSNSKATTTTSGTEYTSGSAKPPTGEAPSGENRREEETTVDGRQEIPPVECNNPPVSTPPPSPATPSSPTTTSSPPTNLSQSAAPTASTPLPLERGQRTRRPPAYLQDFICDRVTSGRYESLAGCRTEKLAAKCGSYEHHGKTKFCEGRVVGGITTLGAHSSGLAQRTRCPAFSYADAVKGRRV